MNKASKKLETWEELNALPIGSVIEFDHSQGDHAAAHPGAMGITTFTRKGDGWYCTADTGEESFVGYGPVQTSNFKLDYQKGDYFTQVVEDAQEGAAA